MSRYIDKNRNGACGLGRNRRLLQHTELVFLSTVCARRVVLVLFTNMDATIVVIGERAKRARHSLVCSIENRGYIYIYIYYILEKWFPLWGERAHSLKLFEIILYVR